MEWLVDSSFFAFWDLKVIFLQNILKCIKLAFSIQIIPTETKPTKQK